jgi:hypothetical protein
MPNIHVATFCEAARVTRSDGARLRREIEKHWDGVCESRRCRSSTRVWD